MPIESAQSALSVPTVIWSGILASFISLAGVVLSNRNSIARLREQLQHDAREKHRDRLSDLREQVYLPLMDRLIKAQGHLGSLAAKDPTAPDFGEPIQAAIAELAKVQIVGARDTAAIAADLTATYSESLLRLLGAAVPLHELKTDIKIAGDMYDQQYAQGCRVLSEITAQNESGAPDPVRFAALQRSFDYYRDQYTQYATERDQVWQSYNAQNRQFMAAVLEETKTLSKMQAKLNFAIRSEVGLDTDMFELQRRLEESQLRAERAIDDLLEKLKMPENDATASADNGDA
jgi:hypothetical protein